MAEATALRNNALPYPVYGLPWTITFPIFDADGDLVTGAAGLDSEVSKNGDTFADCTNEATEIATNSGTYYLTLTGTELTADVVTVIVKTSTTGAKTTPITLYPRKLVQLATGTSQGGAAGYITLAAATVSFDGQFAGCICAATLDSAVEVRVLQTSTASNQQCTVTPNWNTTPDADDTYVIYLPEGRQINTANMTHIANAAVSTSAAQIGVNVIQAAGTAWGSGAITADAVAADAVTKIQNGLATASALATVDGIVDKLDTAMEADGGVYRFTTNALEQAPTGGTPLTAQEVRDAMKLAPSAGSPDEDSIDEILQDIVPGVTAAGLMATAWAGMIEDDGSGGSQYTALALENGPSGSGLDAAGVRSAIGLASANLDTQLGDLPTATENADALLKRDWTSVTGEAARSVLNALRFLRNKWSISGTTLTVTKEDDSTSAWTSTVTADSGADPITGSDPA